MVALDDMIERYQLMTQCAVMPATQPAMPAYSNSSLVLLMPEHRLIQMSMTIHHCKQVMAALTVANSFSTPFWPNRGYCSSNMHGAGNMQTSFGLVLFGHAAHNLLLCLLR